MSTKMRTAFLAFFVLVGGQLYGGNSFAFWSWPGPELKPPGTPDAWYSVSAFTPAPDNSSVSTFGDHTGNGHQGGLYGTGSAPTYKINQLNGYPAVNFLGGSSKSFSTNLNAGSYPITVAIIGREANNTGLHTYMGSGNGPGLGFRVANGGNAGKTQVVRVGITQIAIASSAQLFGSFHLRVIVLTSSTYAFYLDGVANGSGSHSVPISLTQYLLGGEDGTGGTVADQLNGDIAEIIVYFNSSVSVSDIHTYAVNKFNTP